LRRNRPRWPKRSAADARQAKLDAAQEVGRDAEEDQCLKDQHEVARDAGVSLHDRSAGVQGAEQNRRQDDSDAAAEAEQRDCYSVKTRGVAEVDVGQVVVDAGDLNCAG